MRRLAGYAIGDFNMIEDGHRVMGCLSEGKDSYTLLDMPQSLQRRAPDEFELIAVHLDQKQPGYPPDVMRAFLDDRNIEYHLLEQDTYTIVKRVVAEGKTMCGLCSRLRRGLLYTFAREHGISKAALGLRANCCTPLSNYEVQLVAGGGLAGGNVLASIDQTDFLPTAANLIEATLLFSPDPTDPNLGELLVIRIKGGISGQLLVDNVRLDAAPLVPLTPAALLFVSALGALIRTRGRASGR